MISRLIGSVMVGTISFANDNSPIASSHIIVMQRLHILRRYIFIFLSSRMCKAVTQSGAFIVTVPFASSFAFHTVSVCVNVVPPNIHASSPRMKRG